MIKPQDLRIGNLVSVDNEICIVDGLSPKPFNDIHISFINKNKQAFGYYKEVNGIPLTEEWFVKFGFSKKKYSVAGRVFALSDFYGEGFSEVNGKWYLLDYELGDVNDNGIEYVHQLQNFCYALSGTELKFSADE